jgi:mersacidin/lichenicidin family type 2 lantibiotic
MSNLAVNQIVNAWRDEEFFEEMNATQQEEIPSHPVGAPRLTLVKDSADRNSTSFSSPTNCSTSFTDCCGTSFTNTCSTSFTDCCN